MAQDADWVARSVAVIGAVTGVGGTVLALLSYRLARVQHDASTTEKVSARVWSGAIHPGCKPRLYVTFRLECQRPVSIMSAVIRWGCGASWLALSDVRSEPGTTGWETEVTTVQNENPEAVYEVRGMYTPARIEDALASEDLELVVHSASNSTEPLLRLTREQLLEPFSDWVRSLDEFYAERALDRTVYFPDRSDKLGGF